MSAHYVLRGKQREDWSLTELDGTALACSWYASN